MSEKLAKRNAKATKNYYKRVGDDVFVSLISVLKLDVVNSKGNKVFVKIASQRHLKNLIENSVPNTFNFYKFSSSLSFLTSFDFKEPLKKKVIHLSIIQFFNGVILSLIQRVKDNIKQGVINSGKGEKCYGWLSKMLRTIGDKFALSLVEKELYIDLEEYLGEYLFSSSVYQGKVLKFVTEVFKKRYALVKAGSEDKGQRKYESLPKEKRIEKDLEEMDEILLNLVKTKGVESMLSFVLIQIIEEYKIRMSICFAGEGHNRHQKAVLYDSCKLRGGVEVRLVTVIVKMGSLYMYSFGVHCDASVVSEKLIGKRVGSSSKNPQNGAVPSNDTGTSSLRQIHSRFSQKAGVRSPQFDGRNPYSSSNIGKKKTSAGSVRYDRKSQKNAGGLLAKNPSYKTISRKDGGVVTRKAKRISQDLRTEGVASEKNIVKGKKIARVGVQVEKPEGKKLKIFKKLKKVEKQDNFLIFLIR